MPGAQGRRDAFDEHGDLDIAYQVLGDGPIDLVYSFGYLSNIDAFSDDPEDVAFWRGLDDQSDFFLSLVVVEKDYEPWQTARRQ